MMGMTYGNNLLLALTFLLISYSIINMFQTHALIKNFNLDEIKVQNQFSNLGITVLMKVTSRKQPLAESKFECSFINGKIKQPLSNLITSDIPYYRLFTHLKRGVYHYKKLLVATDSPSRFFKSWKYIPIEVTFYVYPANNVKNLLTNAHSINLTKENEEFVGHKHQQTEYKRIDWKKYAKSDKLLAKEYSANDTISFAFDLSETQVSEIGLAEIATTIHYTYHLRKGEWELKTKNQHYQMNNTREHFEESLKELAKCTLT
jgi:hypothetical protein